MAADPRAAAVEEFTARLARSVGQDTTEDLAWLAGESGQRLALLLHHLVGMHLPGVVGSCQDCRWRQSGACMTWTAIADLLAGRETAAVGREFELLRRRYGPQHVPSAGGRVCSGAASASAVDRQ